VRRSFLPAVVVVLVGLIAWRAWALLAPKHEEPLDLSPVGEVADFSLTERGGGTVRRADLLGKVWVAGFAFTRCTGPCPQVTGTMARLQAEFKDEPDFRLVSVSVDPEHDTPEVLRQYADNFGASPDRWFFLTGQKDEVYNLVEKNFKLGVQQNPGKEITHSTKLAVVDRGGVIRGYFEGRMVDDEGKPTEGAAKLKRAVAALLREPR
jgi:protein SCO1/2